MNINFDTGYNIVEAAVVAPVLQVFKQARYILGWIFRIWSLQRIKTEIEKKDHTDWMQRVMVTLTTYVLVHKLIPRDCTAPSCCSRWLRLAHTGDCGWTRFRLCDSFVSMYKQYIYTQASRTHGEILFDVVCFPTMKCFNSKKLLLVNLTMQAQKKCISY